MAKVIRVRNADNTAWEVIASSIPDLSNYATQEYVDNAAAAIVDAAPTTLNTLNELAAALNDDANFATSVTTSLSNKLNKNIEVAQTNANSYTFQLSDSGKLILANGGNENVLYIPDSSTVNFAIGTQINIFQMTSPTVVVYVSDPQSTILYPSSGSDLRAQYSAATIIKIESNSWIIVGDLSP